MWEEKGFDIFPSCPEKIMKIIPTFGHSRNQMYPAITPGLFFGHLEKNS